MNFISEIKGIVGTKNVFSSKADCLGYSRDMSIHIGIPDLIVFVYDSNQISKILKVCHRNNIPIIPRGGGTSVTGATLPMKGGIILDLSRMNKIIEVNLSDRYVTVQSGIICDNLNKKLNKDNFFFPPDPGSTAIATIGGMISTNASGIRAVKYGTTRDYVMQLTVILADGRKLKTGTIAPKSSSGYDLNRLFCSSEGTLGIITEASLKILPLPEYSIFSRLDFPNIELASKAVIEILTSGISISTCEILDNISIDVLKKTINLKVDDHVKCMIMMELDGTIFSTKNNVEKIKQIISKYGIIKAQWTDNPKEKVPLWEARHRLVPAMSRLKPGYRLVPIMEDLGVPLSKISKTINIIQKIGKKYGFSIATFGHIGDGNLHATFIMNVDEKKDWEIVKKITFELIETTIKMKGTLSAEHGIGIAKAPYLKKEIGSIGLEIMNKIKKALDPKNILNPHKMGLNQSIKDIFDKNAFDPIHKENKKNFFTNKTNNEITACIQCGFCRLGCPTYAESGLETMNARGRVNLAFHMLTTNTELDDNFVERFYQCTLCLNCQATCPAQVDLSNIVQAARRKLVTKGLLPNNFQKLITNIFKENNPFGDSKEKRTDFFPEDTPINKQSSNLLYLGCTSAYQDAKIIPSIIKILQFANIDFSTLGSKELCCGYLAYLTGDMNSFDRIKEKNYKILEKLEINKIITACAGCYKTFTTLYNFKKKLSTEHIIFTIENLIKNKKIKFENSKKIKVIYHDPCDLGRHSKIYEPPRNIIKAIPNISLLEFRQNKNLAKCCGGGGGLKAFNNQLSENLAFKRIQEALFSEADILVSACPSCKKSLNQAGARARKERLGKIKIKDISELVASYLKK